jgi:hypothetical protein
MATTVYKNNAAGTLNANIGPTDTAVLLGTGQGARFPSPTAGDWFWATMVHVTTGVVEVVKCTGRSVDTLTVVRGQDGTSATSFTSGSVLEMRVNAEIFRELDYRPKRGVANGLASLDASVKIPVAQIPDLSATYIPMTQRGAVNGVATLDGSGDVPDAQIPAGIARTSALAAYIPLTQRGAANGVATLDAGVKIPVAQIPSLAYLPTAGGSLTGAVTSTNTVSATALTATSTTGVTSNQNFKSSTTTVVLATSAAGSVLLRPNGVASATGQLSLANTGIATAVNFIGTSDRRLKKKLRKVNVQPELADQLAMYDFIWKDNDTEGRSLVAQEVMDFAPKHVHRDGRGYLGVDKGGLALEAIIGLAERVRKLERSAHARRRHDQ